MAEYIEREKLMAFPIRVDHYDEEHGNVDFVLGIECVLEYAQDLPTVDVVSRALHEWIKWERDIAMEQLQEHGIPFGGKADVQAVRHGKWIAQDTSRTKFMCSECKSKNYGGHENYCPHCGAKMG